ncbi:hypothetical protein OUY22_04380 [Nonomuraea sp. MCN248]|uniref:MFS transporter n=1 Tax=Nonomuraea corallina TaxID=2989783 RepID=A0ABT4S635_9ACTN|nr:hypothetical protein [Nonomuraea corallina]MDA0632644.1 hypothetical protein [Nonomuraea corallina]
MIATGPSRREAAVRRASVRDGGRLLVVAGTLGTLLHLAPVLHVLPLPLTAAGPRGDL